MRVCDLGFIGFRASADGEFDILEDLSLSVYKGLGFIGFRASDLQFEGLQGFRRYFEGR